MTKRVNLAWLVLALMAAGTAAAQTTVTTSGGTTNTVPVYTGNSTVGNSPISVSGGNVGIGTTNQVQTVSAAFSTNWNDLSGNGSVFGLKLSEPRMGAPRIQCHVPVSGVEVGYTNNSAPSKHRARHRVIVAAA